MTARKKPHPFATEAELCAAFIEHACRDGQWTAYPECAGWDVLMVRKADGFQVGVQAKMAFNLKVLAQSVETYHGWRDAGPDVRAVLVPSTPDGAADICEALGLALIRYYGRLGRHHFQPDLPRQRPHYWPDTAWPEWHPSRRLVLPEYVPDVPAGVAAPVQLTDWKIKALKLVALLQHRGHVTRADLKALGLDARRWTTPGVGYLQGQEGGIFVASDRLPDFAGQHPTVYAQILADISPVEPRQ